MQISSEKLNELARLVYEKHFKDDPALGMEYDSKRRRLMFQDILYNLRYLEIAVELDDDKIFTDYAVWVYRLLVNLMKDLGKERVRDQMVMHYKILKEVLSENQKMEDSIKACLVLDNAIKATIDAYQSVDTSYDSSADRYSELRKDYLSLLMDSDTRSAISRIDSAQKSGIPLEDIYVDILQESMVEVGNLWHKGNITIDKEHYCTTTTQMAMSQFYPIIFNQPRNGHKLLASCVGSELHEMGIRMVSDLFEFNGWDSYYLGAAVPKDSLLNAIEEYKPDLVALSVTMPFHLPLCHEIVLAVKERFKDTKIAVGGRAFFSTQDIWKKWGADIFTENAIQLVHWADTNIVRIGD
jgi:methanogenic corrinoid protein MtbC1